MKTQSLKLLAWFGIMLFGTLAMLTSCDKIKEDELPQPQAQTQNTFKVRQNSPVAVDLFKRHNLSASATFALKNTPQYGKAKFMSNGILMYAPNPTAVSVTDNVSYEACQSGACQTYNLEMQINTANTPNDTTASCVYLNADVITLNVVLGTINAVTIPMLQNDYFCQSIATNSTISLYTQPARGNAQINGNAITYTYNPSAQSTVNPDLFLYGITVNGQIYYGVVVINLTFPVVSCPLIVNNDVDSLAKNTTKLLKIFDNDSFCADSLANPAFAVVTQPAHGSLGNSTNNYTGINYTPATNYVGNDSFTYKLTYSNGQQKTGTVSIKVKDTTPCNTVLNAVDDNYTYPKSQMVNGSVGLSVLNNDFYCPNPQLTITQQPTPNSGTFTVANNQITYTLPNSTFTGTVTFTYQICVNGACDTAVVTLTITQ